MIGQYLSTLEGYVGLPLQTIILIVLAVLVFFVVRKER